MKSFLKTCTAMTLAVAFAAPAFAQVKEVGAGEGQVNIDTGAREKKAQLSEGIERAVAEQKRRRASTTATRNLKAAVARKAEKMHDGIPENRTTNTGPADTPNDKIAPSGALHAEGMRAAITRSTGDR